MIYKDHGTRIEKSAKTMGLVKAFLQKSKKKVGEKGFVKFNQNIMLPKLTRNMKDFADTLDGLLGDYDIEIVWDFLFIFYLIR